MIRLGSTQDLDLVFSIQREASLAGFAHIFPPELYSIELGTALPRH